GRRERERARPLVVPEEPLPAPRLEPVRREKETACDDHAEDLGVRERPAVLDEMTRREDADSYPDDGGNDVEGDAGAPCAENAQETRKAHPVAHRPQAPEAEVDPGDADLYHRSPNGDAPRSGYSSPLGVGLSLSPDTSRPPRLPSACVSSLGM